MQYPPAVERWRPLVKRHFRPEDVDKALHVIHLESGGNPNIYGDGGHSVGLFQHNTYGLASGRDLAALENPEANIRLAAEAVYGGQSWKPWGEGATYQGKPFGALGSQPYGGVTVGSTTETPATTPPIPPAPQPPSISQRADAVRQSITPAPAINIPQFQDPNIGISSMVDVSRTPTGEQIINQILSSVRRGIR